MPSLQFPSCQSPSSPATMVHGLKRRVIACLNRLADRDTLALAAVELDSIVRSLSPEDFSPFINCLHNTDSSANCPVRKHCVSLLSLLSRSHGDSLAPHLSKMVSTVVRRLRDPESSVRTACAAASAEISSGITGQPFSLISGPMIETLLQDRDPNAQIGAAVCLMSAVDAAAEPNVEQLRQALPKMTKLLKSEGFKAKPELLGAIGSVIGAGGGGRKAAMDWLVPLVSEFLSSEDWRSRKAAAEVLERVAMAEEELAPLYKNTCLAVLESRKFDKVKHVRETMNHTLKTWMQVQDDTEKVSLSPSPKKPSTFSGNKHEYSHTPISNKGEAFDSLQEAIEPKKTRNYSNPRIKRVLFNNTHAPKANGCGSTHNTDTTYLRGSEVVKEEPFIQKAADNLSLIRNQIAQIEKQQSNMLELLQKFIRSSQCGMQTLEARVQGLETTFDVIISRGRQLHLPHSSLSMEVANS